MEERIQQEESISLLDIVHLLLRKLAILILVVILGGFLGGAFAVWRTYGIDYYGTEIQFYVNPEKPKQTAGSESSQYGVYGAYGRHVMDNMVKLLSSDSFTEQLILNGQIIPDASTEEKPWTITLKYASEEESKKQSEILNTQLNDNIQQANVLLAQANEARKNVKDATKAMETALEVVQDAWKTEVPLIPGISSSYWTYSDLAFNYLQSKLSPELISVCEAYHAAKQTTEALQILANEVIEISDAQTETTLTLWRQTDQYKALLNAYSDQITYSYLDADAKIEDVNSLARSFIYVEISVLVDAIDPETRQQQQMFANELYERVIKVVPIYVEANMAIPNDYEGTNCQRITRADEIHLTNRLYTTKEAIKSAFFFAVVSAIIASIIIIIVDRSDKRLRDHETITRLFNIPVLGIIPTIDDLTNLSEAKKKERAQRNILEKKEKAKQEKEQAKVVKQQKPVPAPQKKQNGARR